MEVRIDADEWRAANQELASLRLENKRLKEDLTEFGRHGPGCSNQYGKKYRCKCGWLQVEQALSTDGGQTNEGASLEKSAQGGVPPSVKKGE